MKVYGFHPARPMGPGPAFRAFGGFGPGPFGPPAGFPFGPRGRHGGHLRRPDTRTSLLVLLQERPMTGYDLIHEIAERSDGGRRPSPGSVYPMLQMLEEEGLVSSHDSDGKRLYELTDQGRAEAESRPRAPWEEVGPGGERWETVREFIRAGVSVRDLLRQVVLSGSAEQRTKALALMDETRKKLHLILADEA